MGVRGPQPKPAAVRILEGNPAGRPIPTDFVQPSEPVVCPDHVVGYAREVWYRIVGAMPPGIYTANDCDALATYCVAAQTLKMAAEALQIEGIVIQPAQTVITEADGKTIVYYGKRARNPWLMVFNEASGIVAKLGTQLGLTPIARQSINAPTKQPGASKFAGLLTVGGNG